MRGSGRKGNGGAVGLRFLLLALIVGPGVVSPRGSAGAWNGISLLSAERPLEALAGHHLYTPATAESVTGTDDSSPLERDEARWRHGPDAGPVTGAGTVGLTAPAIAGATPDTEHDGALARAGRRSSWPTGPPVLSL